MSASNQQTLTDSGANDRPLKLKKRNYIPWESRLRKFLDNRLEDGERMWRSIKKGPYVRPMIPDPNDTTKQIIKPFAIRTTYPGIQSKGAARNHDPLALIAHSNTSSQSHASPSYSNSPQPYYVTHPSSVVDYEEDYQGELHGDSQEEKLTTAMMLLARAIT
ncbi:hypothetical protein Tco_0340087 [Tanacetum coccineum]